MELCDRAIIGIETAIYRDLHRIDRAAVLRQNAVNSTLPVNPDFTNVFVNGSVFAAVFPLVSIPISEGVTR